MTKKKELTNAEICRRLVNQLEHDLLDFRNVCQKIPQETVDSNLREAIYELGIGIIHFIDQYRMTDTAIKDINRLPGRTKKFEEREYFRESVHEFQKINPNRFPTWTDFSIELDLFNLARIKHSMVELSIDSRTYDQWKQWWKKGTFDHFVHD